MSREAATAVVVAAGSGRRMGAGRNKVLLPLAGEPVLAHALRALVLPRAIAEIVLVARAGERDELRAIAERIVPPDRLRFADGGAERADSVRAGVAAADAASAILLVHDAARPLVPATLLRALIAAAAEHGAAIPAVPVAETLKRGRDGAVVETVDRAGLFRAQTPQAFRAEVLRAALAATSDALTDDAAFVERSGRPVRLLEGSPFAQKITTPGDLALAEALLPAFLRAQAEAMR